MKSAVTVFLLLLTTACSNSPAAGPAAANTATGAAVPLDSSDTYTLVNAFPSLVFSRPVFLTQVPAPGNLLLVTEQAGTIRSFVPSPTTDQTTTVLDIRDRVLSSGNEQGLLGMALAPDFADSGTLYVNYTAAAPTRTVVSSFQVDPESLLADPSSEKILLQVDQPFSNHNGGMLAFGPDGYLYVGLGDGGSGGDPLNHGQNPHTLLGSILRLSPEESGYSVPEDNPFSANPSAGRAEIWAWGLRNPWRFSFDSLTGALWAADVGQNAYEEINIIHGGGNYGWNQCEGFHRYPASPAGPCPSEFVPPVHEYDHSLGRSVTGGYVYRGERHPGLRGHYVYADFVSRRVWAFEPESGVNQLLTIASEPIASFGQDQNGELFLLGFGGHVLALEKQP